MSRLAEYLKTLSPAERERFAGLVDECRARESAIHTSAARAETALHGLQADADEFWRRVVELRRLSEQLRDTVYQLYLVTAPSQGGIS